MSDQEQKLAASFVQAGGIPQNANQQERLRDWRHAERVFEMLKHLAGAEWTSAFNQHVEETVDWAETLVNEFEKRYGK